ncbi:hypothetical protein [Shewanella colwelliana]|uniref:hypothetical protein n=1 Tax=Shewanella colwelliana TaxID=23 RepID=UPI0022AF3BF7|nr:hypothetical protein [Shewanella colwelliana]MCZ4337737.1 hypothetical protein [Shewanella colwelliana]
MKKKILGAGIALMLAASGYASAVVVECNLSECRCYPNGGVCYCPPSACTPTGDSSQP